MTEIYAEKVDDLFNHSYIFLYRSQSAGVNRRESIGGSQLSRAQKFNHKYTFCMVQPKFWWLFGHLTAGVEQEQQQRLPPGQRPGPMTLALCRSGTL
jgi:hypothetical protein